MTVRFTDSAVACQSGSRARMAQARYFLNNAQQISAARAVYLRRARLSCALFRSMAMIAEGSHSGTLLLCSKERGSWTLLYCSEARYSGTLMF